MLKCKPVSSKMTNIHYRQKFTPEISFLSILVKLFSIHFFDHVIIILLTPWCRILFEKLIVTQLIKNILLSYGTRRFITVFTKARHWTLSWASWIQFTPSIPISPRSILMLSSPYAWVFPVVSCLRASQPKPCKHLYPPPCVPHVHPISFSLISPW
jgi:hypothetical protein